MMILFCLLGLTCALVSIDLVLINRSSSKIIERIRELEEKQRAIDENTLYRYKFLDNRLRELENK